VAEILEAIAAVLTLLAGILAGAAGALRSIAAQLHGWHLAVVLLVVLACGRFVHPAGVDQVRSATRGRRARTW
jgi:hypothetical protein